MTDDSEKRVSVLAETVAKMAQDIVTLRHDRNRHRANEKRLRGAIFEFGMRYPPGSPEREWASTTLYEEVHNVVTEWYGSAFSG